MKSQPDCSENVEKVTNECYSQTPQGAIAVSNEVPQPVSKCVTLPSTQTSVINTISQNEQKGSQLQLTMNDCEDNDSNESDLPQTDGTYNYNDAMYDKNSAVDQNKCSQPINEKKCTVDAVDPNNYVKEKNYNVPEKEQIHVTDGAMNTNDILHDMGSGVDSNGNLKLHMKIQKIR